MKCEECNKECFGETMFQIANNKKDKIVIVCSNCRDKIKDKRE